ncbi:MAG TPA: DUF3443 domain-containing protein [Candidatus Aquilonibacter sp.]|nr:DUF3443 domain-containing protein [Candidatus Aquilonibacter sp.]
MTRRNGVALIAVCAGTLFVAACGGGSSSHQNTIATSAPNVQALSVNPGPAGDYANGVFTSVTVCAPGTSTCQTIGGILVDTGSSGLRILSSALTVSLPQQNAGDGNPVAECLPFVSGYAWGPVQSADIQISGEKGSSVPVQVISNSTFAVPSACSSRGTPLETLSALGANGLLGVGTFAQDCGDACVSTGPGNPELYYECPASGCVLTGEPLSQQVPNPVTFFATDNNGVIIELPGVTTPQPSLSGSLVFGIGTQSNNGLDGATIYEVDADGNFITSYNNQSYNESFLDSGSNGIYFLTSGATGIPVCPDANFFYCPSSPQNLSATTEGANGTGSSMINFSVGNADNLFNDNPTAFVFGDLAGPNSLNGFDWGLPFFFGRNVFTAIDGASTPSGTGPYWAY